MANTRSTIEIIIEGITRGLTGAAAEAEAATRRVEAAEDNVNRARARSEDAASRLGLAEQRLEVARAAQGASTQRIADQETRINDARARSEQAAGRLGQAEADLERVRNSGTLVEVEAAENRLNRARAESESAAGTLQTAERRLDDLRRQQGASSLRVAQAEDALARARRNSESSSGDLARAEEELLRRRNELEDADRRGSPLRSFFAGIVNGINPIRALSTLIGDVTTRMGGFGQALGAIGGPIVQAVTGIIAIVAAMSLWVEIVGVIGGLIGQALAGVPALLFVLAAAAGTVVLGLDGIKKAAEVMAPAFDKLKASISDTFAKQLTPVFQRLALVIPQLTGGFNQVAFAVSGLIKNLAGVVTSTQGIQQLQSVLAGTAAFVNGLSGGISRFLSGILAAAAASQTAMQALGTAIGDIFGKIGDVFTKLAANGVIQAAVAGLAATIEGLANVLGPVVELLIRMGAALGDSVGVALTDLGAGIENVIPFFEKLAQVAGQVLVDAFDQLGPPLRELVDSILPGAAAGLDGFASVMHNVVLPAVAGFINWIRTDGIPGFIAFTQAMIINVTGAASAILGFVSGALGALEQLFIFLAVATNNPAFLKIAGDIEVAKGKVDGFKASVDQLHDKTVAIAAGVTGGDALKSLHDTIATINNKTVTTISNVLGLPENQGLKSAIDLVPNKTVQTLSNVIGRVENDLLTAAIKAVTDKTVKTVSNVFGEQENKNLRAAIDTVINKTVQVVANVFGTGAVQGLVDVINAVHSVTATVTTIIRTITQAFASGGPAPGGVPILVGEQGPEIITLPRGGGFVFTAAQTRAMLSAGQGAAIRTPLDTSTGGGDPITINVLLSQERIAEIARVEIVAANRSVRRTVLAGSGTTF